MKSYIRRLFEFRENIFKTNYRDNVLICYILGEYSFIYKIKNFFDKRSIAHTNFLEIRKILEIFRKLNFNVDVIEYMSAKNIDYKKYDVIFGFGKQYERAILENQTSIKIYYGTGAHVCQRNFAELERIKELKKRKGVVIKPKRLLNPYWYASTVLSNAMIVLGNNFTINTYKEYFDGKIYNIPVSAFTYFTYNDIQRNYNNARKNFLWFGSSGLVLKGLDICIEVFSKLPEDYVLHICGPREEDFFKIYQNELYSKNIIYHGFVDPKSEEMKKIVSQCGFVIFPSASEGQSTSLLTSMCTGLIPITTIESGINVDSFGFLIEDLNIKEIKDLIIEISQISECEFMQKSKQASEYVLNNHSLNNFEIEFEKAVKLILEGYFK